MNAVTLQESEPTQHATSLKLAMDPNSMDAMLRVAEIMSAGRATVPKHLQNNVADCLAVVMQAMNWGMSPFVVAQKTHLVNGALGYEAQLVNAVVQASGAITSRFHYEYEGKSPALLCRVGAVIKGETEITWGNWLNEKDVGPKNSPLWKTNPPQQLGYLQVKNWSRLYTPGSIFGVYTPDEIENFKPPREMGAADVLDATPAIDADSLIKEGWGHAEKGMGAFGPWFNGMPKMADGKQRAILAPLRDAMLAKAKEADKVRTVEPEAQASEPTGEITAYDVMEKLNAAANEDALNVAADCINAITDNEQVKALNQLYNERLAELRG